MLHVSGYCLLSGEGFSPLKFEDITGLRFDEKNEPAQIGRTGKFNGRPIPFGSGTIYFESQADRELLPLDPIVANLLIEGRDLLAAHGVSEINVHFDVEYSGQCNLEFSPVMLQMLSKLNVPIGITCFEAMLDDMD